MAPLGAVSHRFNFNWLQSCGGESCNIYILNQNDDEIYLILIILIRGVINISSKNFNLNWELNPGPLH